MSSISFLFIITTELSRTEHVMRKMLNIYTTKSNFKRRISKDVIQQYIQYSCLVGWGGVGGFWESHMVFRGNSNGINGC